MGQSESIARDEEFVARVARLEKEALDTILRYNTNAPPWLEQVLSDGDFYIACVQAFRNNNLENVVTKEQKSWPSVHTALIALTQRLPEVPEISQSDCEFWGDRFYSSLANTSSSHNSRESSSNGESSRMTSEGFVHFARYVLVGTYVQRQRQAAAWSRKELVAMQQAIDSLEPAVDKILQTHKAQQARDFSDLRTGVVEHLKFHHTQQIETHEEATKRVSDILNSELQATQARHLSELRGVTRDFLSETAKEICEHAAKRYDAEMKAQLREVKRRETELVEKVNDQVVEMKLYEEKVKQLELAVADGAKMCDGSSKVLAECRANLNAAQCTVEILEKGHADYAEMKRRNYILEERVAQYEKLGQKVQGLEAANEELTKHLEPLREMTQTVESLTRRNQALQGKLEVMERTQSNLEHARQDLQQGVRQSEASQQKLIEEKHTLTTHLEDITKEKEFLTERLRQSVSTEAQLSDSLRETSEECTSLKNERALRSVRDAELKESTDALHRKKRKFELREMEWNKELMAMEGELKRRDVDNAVKEENWAMEMAHRLREIEEWKQRVELETGRREQLEVDGNADRWHFDQERENQRRREEELEGALAEHVENGRRASVECATMREHAEAMVVRAEAAEHALRTHSEQKEEIGPQSRELEAKVEAQETVIMNQEEDRRRLVHYLTEATHNMLVNKSEIGSPGHLRTFSPRISNGSRTLDVMNEPENESLASQLDRILGCLSEERNSRHMALKETERLKEVIHQLQAEKQLFAQEVADGEEEVKRERARSEEMHEHARELENSLMDAGRTQQKLERKTTELLEKHEGHDGQMVQLKEHLEEVKEGLQSKVALLEQKEEATQKRLIRESGKKEKMDQVIQIMRDDLQRMHGEQNALLKQYNELSDKYSASKAECNKSSKEKQLALDEIQRTQEIVEKQQEKINQLNEPGHRPLSVDSAIQGEIQRTQKILEKQQEKINQLNGPSHRRFSVDSAIQPTIASTYDSLVTNLPLTGHIYGLPNPSTSGGARQNHKYSVNLAKIPTSGSPMRSSSTKNTPGKSVVDYTSTTNRQTVSSATKTPPMQHLSTDMNTNSPPVPPITRFINSPRSSEHYDRTLPPSVAVPFIQNMDGLRTSLARESSKLAQYSLMTPMTTASTPTPRRSGYSRSTLL